MRLSRTAAEETDYLDSELENRWQSLAKVEEGAVSLDARAMATLHPALQRRALRRAYSIAAGDARTLSESHLDAMLHLVENRRGGRSISLPRGLRARIEADVLRIASQDESSQLPPLSRESSVRVPREIGEAVEVEAGEWLLKMRMGTASGQQGGGDPSVLRFTAA